MNRRRPVAPASRVRHIDGREGTVDRLEPCEGLPGAVVIFDGPSGPAHLPLGFLEPIPA